MTTEIRYYTRSGNTEKLAKTIGEALEKNAEAIDKPLENWPPHSRDFSRELGGQSACNGLH